MTVEQPIDLNEFQNTIHHWLNMGTELETVRLGESGPQTEYPFAGFRIANGPQELTHSWSELQTFDGTRALGREIEQKKEVDCNITVECQFYVKMPSDLNAISYANAAIGRLQKAEQQDLFAAINVAVRQLSSPQSLPTSNKNQPISRAFFSIIFGGVMSVVDYVGYANKVQAVNASWGADWTLNFV